MGRRSRIPHGALSPGIATPDAIGVVIREHGAIPRFVALRHDKSRRDIGSMGRYGPAMEHQDAQLTFTTLGANDAITALALVRGENGRPIADVAAVGQVDTGSSE